MTKNRPPLDYDIRDRLDDMSLIELTEVLVEAKARGPAAIARACTFLQYCNPPSKCVRAVLGYPHPAFVHTILTRFGKTTFNSFKDCPELSYNERTSPEQFARLDLLELDELKEVLPQLYKGTTAPYWFLPAMLREARRRGDIMLFADLIAASGQEMKSVMAYVDAIAPWDRKSPELISWCAAQYREVFPAGSENATWQLLNASIFANIHDYCALFVLGQDMSEKAPRAMPPETWAESFHDLASSNHGRLRLRECLAHLDLEDIFAMTHEQLHEQIAPAVKATA